jgi:hypothetical protein
MACALAAGSAGAQEYASLRDAAVAHGLPGGTGEAQGDVLETFANSWAVATLGVAIDHGNPAQMFYFHEASPSPGIWIVNVAAPHSATAFTYSKLGSPNTDGGSVRTTDGYIYASDYNGDLSAIDDNIYLFDRSGNTVAYWQIDNPGCTGGAVDQVIDVAVDPSNPALVYATTFGGNAIYHLDLSDTSGGSVSLSTCVLLGTATAAGPITDVWGIEYDPQNDGFWLSDFNSATVMLVANDGTFTNVMETFAAQAGGGFTAGLSQQTGGGPPIPLWVTDFTSNSTAIVDSGTVPVELQTIDVE